MLTTFKVLLLVVVGDELVLGRLEDKPSVFKGKVSTLRVFSLEDRLNFARFFIESSAFRRETIEGAFSFLTFSRIEVIEDVFTFQCGVEACKVRLSSKFGVFVEEGLLG